MLFKHNKGGQDRYFEEKFKLKKLHKRNREFFDIQLVDNIEKQEVIRRRVPYERSSFQVDGKFNDSFMNSTQAQSFKVQSAIQKYKQRVSTSLAIPRLETQQINDRYRDKDRQGTIQQQQGESSNKIRGPQWKNMLSRDQASKSIQKQYTQNQQRYNNFYLTTYNESKTRHFDKYPQKFPTQPSKPQDNSSIDIDKCTKAQLNIKFFRSTTPWTYKQQKWDRGPIYSQSTKHQSIHLNDIPEEKIKKCKNKVLPKWNKVSNKFQKYLSREISSQFQRIYHSPNCNYRNKRFPTKTKTQSKKIRIESKRPFVNFQRNEICDGLYFRRQSLKQAKNKKLYTQ